MLKNQLEADLVSAKAKILSVEQSTIFSAEYKEREIMLQNSFINNIQVEPVALDKILDQRMPLT